MGAGGVPWAGPVVTDTRPRHRRWGRYQRGPPAEPARASAGPPAKSAIRTVEPQTRPCVRGAGGAASSFPAPTLRPAPRTGSVPATLR